METPLNQKPSNTMPQKKGQGALVAVIVLVLIILAGLLFWPEHNPTNDIPASADEQEEDLGSIEADLEATNVDGMSDGL